MSRTTMYFNIMERVPDEVLDGTQQAVQLGQHNGERVHCLKALGELQREQLLTVVFLGVLAFG